MLLNVVLLPTVLLKTSISTTHRTRRKVELQRGREQLLLAQNAGEKK